MEIAEAQEFLKNNHRGVLVTRKKNGSMQMTLVSPVIDEAGKVIITSRETTFKVKNIKRNSQVSLFSIRAHQSPLRSVYQQRIFSIVANRRSKCQKLLSYRGQHRRCLESFFGSELTFRQSLK